MRKKANLTRTLKNLRSKIILQTPKMIFLCLIVLLGNSCTIIEIKENQRGVRFEKFNGGLNPDVVYGSGFHIFPIWDREIIYNIDTMTHDEKFYLNSLDSNQYEIDLVLKYKVIPNKIGYLENTIGKNYYNPVIIQEIERTFSKYFIKQTSDSILAIDTNKLQSDILKTVSKPIRKNHIKMISITINQISKST